MWKLSKNSQIFHSPSADGSILRFSVCHAPAGQVALHLGLVDAIHGDPDHAAPHQDGPEGVALQWVRVEAAVKGKVSGGLAIRPPGRFPVA